MVGTLLEPSESVATGEPAHREGTVEGHNESTEHAEGSSATSAESHTLGGVDIEGPGPVALGALASFGVAAALWRRASRSVVIVAVALGIALAALDLVELRYHLDEDRTALAALAGGIALGHLVAAATAGLSGQRGTATPVAVGSHPGRNPMKPIPLHDETAPIACTITAAEIPERIELIERLRANLTGIDSTEQGLLLHLPDRADIAEDLRRFVIDEKRCCQFWGFLVETYAAETTLRWEGPAAAAELLGQLHDYFLGNRPITGLL